MMAGNRGEAAKQKNEPSGYLKVDAKSEVLDPENPDPKVAVELHQSEMELRQIIIS
jgi:hypothetical protein